ncbi:hypothetical protein ACKVMT_15930 [Halobacteriales archaeon Cl-PHB]
MRRRTLLVATGSVLAGCASLPGADQEPGTETQAPTDGAGSGTALVRLEVDTGFDGHVTLTGSCTDHKVVVGGGAVERLDRTTAGETCAYSVAIGGNEIVDDRRVAATETARISVDADGDITVESAPAAGSGTQAASSTAASSSS